MDASLTGLRKYGIIWLFLTPILCTVSLIGLVNSPFAVYACLSLFAIIFAFAIAACFKNRLGGIVLFYASGTWSVLSLFILIAVIVSFFYLAQIDFQGANTKELATPEQLATYKEFADNADRMTSIMKWAAIPQTLIASLILYAFFRMTWGLKTILYPSLWANVRFLKRLVAPQNTQDKTQPR